MTIEITSFITKVQEMRSAQKAYFKFRGDPEKKKGILIRSKQLEVEVDQEAPRLLGHFLPVDLTQHERTRVIGELSLLLTRTENITSRKFIEALIVDLKDTCKREIRNKLESKEASI